MGLEQHITWEASVDTRDRTCWPPFCVLLGEGIVVWRPVFTRERLDGTAVDIEFLLIAVIQGFALATLAVDAEPILTGEQAIYWPYLLAAFVLILNFWALAIMHSISFISWPFDLVHTLLYFLVGFVEVASFSQITHPAGWFAFMLVFFAVSGVLYVWDLRMIRARRDGYQGDAQRRALYARIESWQLGEVRLLLPAAVVFEAVIVAVIVWNPALILEGDRHLLVIGAQNVFGLAYLAMILRGFARRRALIDACVEATA